MSIQYHPGRVESTFRTERQKLGDRAHFRSFEHDLLPPCMSAGEQDVSGINDNVMRSQTTGHTGMSSGVNARGRRRTVRITEPTAPTNHGSTAALLVAFGFGVLLSRILPSK